jgi:hypothetical protein
MIGVDDATMTSYKVIVVELLVNPVADPSLEVSGRK